MVTKESKPIDSKYRSKIDQFSINNSMHFAIIIACTVIAQIIIIGIFSQTWVLNVIYFFVGIGRVIKVSEQALSGLFFLNIAAFSIISARYFEKLIPIRIKEYLPCPYEDCNKSVKVYEDWQCDKCNNYQGKNAYISDNCLKCGRKLDSVFCEHCHREIKL